SAPQAARRKPTSNGALLATSTAPSAKNRNCGSTAGNVGAVATMRSVIPVSTATNGGVGSPGLARLWTPPSSGPPHTLTAPISVIAARGPAPVVSRSTTTNVASRSGVPSSSNVPWTAAWVAAIAVMFPTVGVLTDSSTGPTRRMSVQVWPILASRDPPIGFSGNDLGSSGRGGAVIDPGQLSAEPAEPAGPVPAPGP